MRVKEYQREFVKKENECCDLQGGSTMISACDARNLGDQQLEAQINDTNGHRMNNYSEGARLNRENTTFENPTPPEVLDRVRVESTSILSGTLAAGVDSFAPAGVAVSKVKNEMFDDFDEDLDHVLLIERLRMLLSRRALGLMNQHVEGGSGVPSGDLQCFLKEKAKSMFASEERMEIGNVLHDKSGSYSPRHCSPSVVCSPNATLSGSYFSSNHSLNKSTESGNDMELKEDEICSLEKVATELGSRHLTNHVPQANLLSSTKVKDEPYDHGEGCSIYGKDMNNVYSNTLSIKSETTMPDEPYENKVDDMPLQDRMKFFSSRKDFGFTSMDHEHPKPSDPGCSVLVSEPVNFPNTKRRRKQKKTATNSIETALEEDAPGLLQILVEKGIQVDEIKLYGETESDDDLDESASEDSFRELEDVITRLFPQRPSFLKFPSIIRCMKASRASYCLACLVSLIEQTRYLHFRNWPVEWGWCRDLQSFIFVFERHKRIVMERPEYGYATYFFELVESLPISWQIKRLVIAMKLTNCSRISLLENRPLLVGEDLTEGEAEVLLSYGWMMNSGLGTMLNYRGRVVHDRSNEDISEWRSKIGKLLMDGYNGGALVLENTPKKVAEYSSSQATQVKLEL
ncbi:uncharacterized protein LOC111808937 isoform X2 [Cucurbita pepo subsp. pepo]|uniref:uncharacterized protein LOC111808937 isoform X2 n=1 Tax=Cucurbita pepo subsp. pepo TaxID=3664 RepID=UPI000C9D935B|nr:uncharacterized protein LOC111808937 isoform X2 [Cucurbita pepo subsp. pepo]